MQSSGILVDSDFSSKDTSLWSSGTCTVLIASIKVFMDCSVCQDSSVKGFSIIVRYLVGKSANHRTRTSGMHRYANNIMTLLTNHINDQSIYTIY